ncbi:hypothetical protein D7W79_18145 [Corallococcus exercitus]|uniref:Uncharacterized protein n=1 Tax=Corallococcus exercitus TaxID=2316736 RepID=A0A3A8I0Z5_9BACT|nr:hypothetical protein [Corallococcus exercitus]NOK37964.1 hypothetical protein [Corallococcus exercitus]RKG76286.1 hypothetical protein D7W79_18145 [Corallococcus exercitus]
MAPLLHRYWIHFPDDAFVRSRGLNHGCGVTAYSLEDARGLLQEQLFRDTPLPPFTRVIEDVDVTTLEANHIRPNIGVVTWRGIWFPFLQLS